MQEELFPELPASKADNFDAYEPVGHYLLLAPSFAAEKSTGGLFIPEAARAHLTQGTVVKRGKLVENFDIGDEVIFTQHTEVRLNIDGRPYILLEDQHIALYKPVATNPNNDINRLTKMFNLPFATITAAYLDHQGDFEETVRDLSAKVLGK